jgi:hypothetical protein
LKKKNESVEMNDKTNVLELNIEETKDDEQEEQTKDIKQKFYKRAFFWVCGIEKSIKKKTKAEIEAEKAAEASLMEISIEEEPFWGKVNKINLVFQLCICGFLWVFFNKY